MQKSQRFEVLLPGDCRAEEVRATFRNRMEKLYIGWDDTFDRQYDNHSFLFLLHDGGGEFLATCRLVFKYRGRNVYLTPMEMGDVSRFSISCQAQKVCEGGMMSFVSKEAALKLSYGVCRWMTENRVECCYTTYDIRNILIKRLYTQKLGFSMVDGAVIKFSEFKSRKNGLPVEWQVLYTTLDKSWTTLTQLETYNEGFYYEGDKYPRLTDWLNAEREMVYQ